MKENLNLKKEGVIIPKYHYCPFADEWRLTGKRRPKKEKGGESIGNRSDRKL